MHICGALYCSTVLCMFLAARNLIILRFDSRTSFKFANLIVLRFDFRTSFKFASLMPLYYIIDPMPTTLYCTCFTSCFRRRSCFSRRSSFSRQLDRHACMNSVYATMIISEWPVCGPAPVGGGRGPEETPARGAPYPGQLQRGFCWLPATPLVSGILLRRAGCETPAPPPWRQQKNAAAWRRKKEPPPPFVLLVAH